MRKLFSIFLIAVCLAPNVSAQSGNQIEFDDELLKHYYFYRSENDSFVVFSDSLIHMITQAGQLKDHFQRIYTDRGNYFDHIGEPSRAFDEFDHMYNLALHFKDTIAFGYANGSIAWLNSKYDREELAIQRLKVNLKLWQEVNDYEHMANACHNLQLASIKLERWEDALMYARKQFHYNIMSGNPSHHNVATYWLARAYVDVVASGASRDSSLLDSAIVQNAISQAFNEEHEEQKHFLDDNYLLTGRIHLMKGDSKNALVNCQEAENMARIYGKRNDDYVEICNCLAEANSSQGNYKEGLVWKEEYRHLKDSVASLDYSIELQQKELSGDLEKDKLESKLLAEMEAEKKKIELDNELDTMQNYLIIGAALAVIFFLVVLWIKRNARDKEKTNQQILHYNREITDSINYARRIQSAILPNRNVLKEHLDFFIYYQPKDIVAGDFYWFEPVGDIKLFAAADCTGHGVPGAMVSVVCHNALNRAVREFGLTEPGQILDKTKDLVVEAFQNRGFQQQAIKDGMDISLCSFGPQNGNGYEIKFAGAHNPIWILRDGANEIEITKGTRQPIGETDKTVPFETHTFHLNKGDLVYFFTDGFADQFGGPEGKKFRYKEFKSLLIKNSSLPLLEQRHSLEDALIHWMGDMEQIDDVCIIGVKI